MFKLEQSGGPKTDAEVGHPEDSYLVFVNWLTTRTAEGNLNWDLQSNLLSAKLRTMVAQFATSSTDHLRDWSLFTVFDDYAELMRVHSCSCGNPALALAVSRLFETIIKSSPSPSNE